LFCGDRSPNSSENFCKDGKINKTKRPRLEN
jgi:hypothetical protein